MPRQPITLLLAAAVALLIAPVSIGAEGTKAEKESFGATVDEIFAELDRDDGPGCAMGAVHRGAFVHKAAYGMADLEHGVPLTTRSVFRIASVSKQFTAMAVLLLAEAGEARLDADVRQYLPGLRDYETTVTVNAMLGHVSGMGDYDWIGRVGAWPDGALPLRSAAGGHFRFGDEGYLTIDEFYDTVCALRLQFPAMTRFHYSNLAYFLLSMLVEEVTDRTLREFAAAEIFGPLGMEESFFNDDSGEIVKNRAMGYVGDGEGGYRADMTNLDWVGDGGVHTSVEDFLHWDHNFFEPSLGRNPKALIERMNTPNSALGEDGLLYANGQFVGERSDYGTYVEPVFQHSGAWLGASAYYVRYPTRAFSVFVFCNDADADAATLSTEVAEAFFARR